MIFIAAVDFYQIKCRYLCDQLLLLVRGHTSHLLENHVTIYRLHTEERATLQIISDQCAEFKHFLHKAIIILVSKQLASPR